MFEARISSERETCRSYSPVNFNTFDDPREINGLSHVTTIGDAQTIVKDGFNGKINDVSITRVPSYPLFGKPIVLMQRSYNGQITEPNGNVGFGLTLEKLCSYKFYYIEIIGISDSILTFRILVTSKTDYPQLRKIEINKNDSLLFREEGTWKYGTTYDGKKVNVEFLVD